MVDNTCPTCKKKTDSDCACCGGADSNFVTCQHCGALLVCRHEEEEDYDTETMDAEWVHWLELR